MMVYCPGVEPRRERALVQNVDIAPTMLDAAGIEPAEPMHGRSLMPVARGEVAKIRDFAHSGFFGRNHVVNDGRYAYHLWHTQECDLYWHGLTDSLFVGAGPLGPVEPEQRRKVKLAGDGVGRKLPSALFDLEHDPEQKTNIAGDHPDIVRRFEDEIRRWCTEVCAPKEYVARLLE
jgi:arylsulfatase A-like enzyme